MATALIMMAVASGFAVGISAFLLRRSRVTESAMIARRDALEVERRNHAAFLKLLGDDVAERLSAIHGHSELLLGDWRGQLMSAQADSIRRIQAVTRGLAELAADAALVSTVNSGDVKFHSETVSLAAAIEPLMSEYRELAAECGQRVHVALSGEAATLFIDPPWFARVVRCVMGSVVRIAAPGSSIFVTGKKVGIPPGAAHGEHECFCLSFSMTSSLVRADDLMPVFGERVDLRRLAPASASRLLAARQIARAMGGDVSVAGRSTNPIVQVTIPGS